MHFCPWRGIVAPVALLALGGYCIVTQTGWIPGRRSPGMTIHGTEAIVMGTMFIALGIGLHGHYTLCRFEPIQDAMYTLGYVFYMMAVGLLLLLVWLVLMRVFG